jgi:hypothetical protein
LGVVAAAAGNTQTRGCQQQADDEAVTAAAGDLAPVVPAALLGPACAVATVEGVLGLLSLLTDIGLVED